jgi:hypothetical protein
MSYDTSKFSKLGQLKLLAEMAKKADDALDTRVKTLEDVGAQANVIEAVKVNGTALDVADKAVDVTVPTKVSDLENDKKYQTDTDVDASINAKVSSTYKAAGSTTFAELPALEEANLGKVYNVTDAFTTTDDFVEGKGQKYPAGTNVAIVLSGDEYKYDALAGFVDLSGYVEKEEGKSLVSDTEIAKLSGVSESANKTEASETNGNIKVDGEEVNVYKEPDDVLHGEVATDDEVKEMLEDVFGTSGE